MKQRRLHLGDTDTGAPVYLSPKERTTGVQIFGAPGKGKSQGANHMLDQDARDLPGGGLVLDPHGNDPDSLYAQGIARAVRYRPRRPMYFVNLSVPNFVYGFNIFARRAGGDVSTRVQRCVRALFTAWGEPDPYERPRLLFWSNAIFAVGMHHGNVGLTEMRLLLDHEQAALRAHLTAGTPVASRWRALNHKRLDQFDEQVESARNRIDALTSATGPRRFLSLIHPPAMLDFRDLFARRAWVFVNLQQSPDLDREHARVIGTLLAADFIDQACQRPSPKRAPVALYLDEAHQFISRDLAMAFEEGRKFHIYTTLMHQHLEQLREGKDERVLNAILNCALTKMVFAVGSDRDAKALVHEVFVGRHGINYTEVKHVQPQTKFRPVAGRDQSVSHGDGGGTTHSVGGSRGRTTGKSHTTGQGRTHTEGRNTGRSTGETAGTTHSVGATRTAGRNTTRSVADGVSEGHTTSESRTIGTAHTVGYSRNQGRTVGTSTTTSRATTTTEDPEGFVTHTETDSSTTSDTWNDVEGFSEGDTSSESVTQGESDNTGRSRVTTHAEGENESDGETWSDAQTETDSVTDSEGWSETDADTESKSDSDSTSESKGDNWSDSDGRNWSKTISDVPVTRHEEFREDAPQFFTLEEQRQRKADELRMLPQRTFVLRRPDCSNITPTVPFRKPLRFSDRLLRSQEARCAAKTGALPSDQADALIAERCREVESRAQKFAAAGKTTVHYGDAPDDEPPSPTRLKRRAPKKSAPEGQGGAQG